MIVDHFAGPGGWDQGLRMLGRTDTVGFEWDMAACETAVEAGHKRICADVATYPTEPFRGKTKAYIGSPSCTLFSNAGKGTGRDAMELLTDATRRMFAGDDCRVEVRDTIFTEFTHPSRIADNDKRKAKAELDPTQARKVWSDERVAAQARTDAFIASLVLEPARFIHDVRPPVIALEQVPTVLPIWQEYVRQLKIMGYSAWTGVLCAADYGVPQTRYRAIVMASLLAPVQPPPATHSEHGSGPDLFGNSTEKWVSMATALGWGFDDEPSATVSSGGAATGGAEPFANAGYRKRLTTYVQRERSGDRAEEFFDAAEGPAQTVIAKTRSWVRMGNQERSAVRHVGEPAPTVLFGAKSNKVEWFHERPATTVVGSFSPETISPPGYRTDVSRQNAEGGVKVTVAEGGVLQSFPADYPWQGSRTKQYEQVGNAVPPLLAAHIGQALGLGTLTSEVAA